MAHPSPTSPRRQAAIPALLAAFALLLGACSNADRPTLADRAAPTSVTSTTAPLSTATTEVGAPTTFAVLGDPGVTSAATNGWYKVLIPTRPNQGTAWVPAASVALTQTPMRVFISLADRTLRVENNGASVFDTTVAIGTDENPTPLGATYITELIQNTNPGGAYGPYAFGLALHSETLTEFAGGPGQVGVHGTNQPDLIGQAVSHGCVRLNNDDIQALVDLQLPLGVPVLIS